MIPSDILERAPSDTGCRAACLEYLVKTLCTSIEHGASKHFRDFTAQRNCINDMLYARKVLTAIYGEQ